MRVTIIGINYAPEVTGIAPYTTGIAEGLAERGHDVTVITGLPHYPQWRVAEEYRGVKRCTEVVRGVTVHRVGHHVPAEQSALGRIRMEASFGSAAATHKWDDPDVVITVSPALLSAAQAVLRARLSRIPVGVVVQDVYSKGVVETGVAGGRSAVAAARLESTVLRLATGVAVIHPRFVDSLAEIGVNGDDLAVIRNWTHIEGAAPASGSAAVREKYGWRAGETIVMHTGNMGVKQGLENVVAAGKLVDGTQAGDIRFVLIGDGNQRRMLDDVARDAVAVQLIDPLPDDEFRAALAAADILLVNERPGVGEMAVPSKLTSYFVAAKPILAATEPTSGTAEELRASGAGLVIPAGDPEALVESVRHLAADEQSRQRFGSCGAQYARERLGAANAVAQYEKWVGDLASAARGRPT
ncbi:WcaI family glycosyltransferase [Mycolicibacterium sp. 050232]|uniref:WcaI family glycosyltransferase n=1 Tax=Mycolicibacterium sp. 050232 TaxID=3113982 RepID=UPI002E2CF302|nr:WcaI family glycosyltransferase [Mycolicibacterium sp. 050232]MED5812398.1 WcaI family glycosyltransferase [Mycolicibacterium sp. 050232]